MSLIAHTFRQLGVTLILVVFVVGCGESTSTISGVVNFDGKPISLEENEHGTVMFQPASRQGPTLNGSIQNGGKFELLAGTSSHVAPGVYLATVSAVEVLPSAEGTPGGRRITPDRYASSSESGLRVVIKPGENSVVLDLKSDQSQDGTAEESVDNAEKNIVPLENQESADRL